jgi:hypothetical protein
MLVCTQNAGVVVRLLAATITRTMPALAVRVSRVVFYEKLRRTEGNGSVQGQIFFASPLVPGPETSGRGSGGCGTATQHVENTVTHGHRDLFVAIRTG